MHADKHNMLLAAGPDVAKAVQSVAMAHAVTVDDVVREALQRGARPGMAARALAGLPKPMQAQLAKLLAWPWDCQICRDSVDKIDSCAGGHLQCARCVGGPCPLCAKHQAALAAANARIAAEASARLAEITSQP